ncbi:YjfB family protein [Fibrobacterota bacterium]
MELSSSTDVKQSEVQASVQMAVQKKSLEQEETQAMKLVNSLPQTKNAPGGKGGVDITA